MLLTRQDIILLNFTQPDYYREFIVTWYSTQAGREAYTNKQDDSSQTIFIASN